MPARRIRAAILTFCLAAALSWSPDTGLAPALLAKPSTGDLTLISLNLAMRDDADAIVASMREIGADRADVIALQEVIGTVDGPSVADEIAAALGPDYAATYAREFTRGDGRTVGQATVARLPVANSRVLSLKKFNLNFHSRNRVALAVTYDTPAGRLRTYNVHLDTRVNGGDRIDQIAGVIEDIDSAPGRALILGDFNTNNNLWLLHAIPVPFVGRQTNSLAHYMARHGFESVFDGGSTHDALRMRLDWVFLKDLHATARAIHPMAISDHHALVVSITP